MNPPISSLELSSMQFKAEFRSSVASSVFEIEHHGNRYALKVFHNSGDPGFTEKGRDLSRFRSEAKAYNNLHAFGVCDRSLVPKYYGSIDRFDPTCHQPWLNGFVNDKFYPSAILLEYLAGREPLNCVNYSKERLSKAMESLVQVHSALIVHKDLHPKNILIVPGTLERVIVVDFGVADTSPTKELQDQAVGIRFPEPVQACKFEVEILIDFGELLEEDQKEGLPTRSFTRHPSCPVSFLLSAYDSTIDNNVKCICWHRQPNQLRGLGFGATPSLLNEIPQVIDASNHILFALANLHLPMKNGEYMPTKTAKATAV